MSKVKKSLIPLSKWNEHYQYPTTNQLRWFNYKNENGFNCCVVKLGRQLYINEAKFWAWVESCQEG